MIFREALISDIPQIQVVRNLVKENSLPYPTLITDEECIDFITRRGKGWVCEIEGEIVGFAIVDLRENNIWALFINPAYEAKGIGKKLHDIMLNWYFEQTKETLWLGTSPNTRAAEFYKINGWKETGKNGPKEIKFEMSESQWEKKKL